MISDQEMQERRRQRLFDAILNHLKESIEVKEEDQGHVKRFKVHGFVPRDSFFPNEGRGQATIAFLMFDGSESDYVAVVTVNLPVKPLDIPSFSFSRRTVMPCHGYFSHSFSLEESREHFIRTGKLPESIQVSD